MTARPLTNATVPHGWTPRCWHQRLIQMAEVCYDEKKAEDFREWAKNVSEANRLGVME